MHNQEDFFSPDTVDERLELSLRQRATDLSEDDPGRTAPDLRLISDLRYLYGAEGTENVRSLQRVWEQLQEHPRKKERTAEPGMFETVEPKRERHLYLLKPVAPSATPRKPGVRRVGGRLALLAALLFVMVMAGSLLTIVHLTRAIPATVSQGSPVAPATPATPAPTSIPGYLYNPPGRLLVASPPSPDAIDALAWSPNGRQLAISTQGQIWLLDVVSKAYRPLLTAQLAGGSVKALSWSPNSHYLAVGTSPVQIVDTTNGGVVGTYSADYPGSPVLGQTTLVTALAWSRNDGSMLAVATRHADGTCYVVIWDVLKKTGIYTFTGQGSASGIASISWSGDNRYVASSDTHTVQAWQVNNGYLLFKQNIDAATDVAWSPGPGLLAFVNQQTTQIWDVWQGPRLQGKLVSNYPAGSGLLSWSSASDQGKYLATVSGKNVFILDAATGAPLYKYTGNTQAISVLAWSPDGQSIATGEGGASGLNVARVWSA